MNRKFIEMRIALVEQEIKFWESRLNSAEVNLRKQKELWWELIDRQERWEVAEWECGTLAI